MKPITITAKKEVRVTTLALDAHVRYWADATVNGVEGDDYDDRNADPGIPCRKGDRWCPVIDIATGTIEDWPNGTTATVHYKVCDECGWALLDKEGNIVLEAKDGYVPDTLCPKEEGYGDYIIMDINEDGVIDGWEFNSEDFKRYAE